VAPLEMNTGTFQGKSTIGPSGRSVERPRDVTLPLTLTTDGKWKGCWKGDTVTVKTVGEKCLVLGDSIVRNVGAENSNMRVGCFPDIRVDQLRRVMEKGLGIFRYGCNSFGTDYVRKSRYLDYIMGEVCDLVNTAKAKFPWCFEKQRREMAARRGGKRHTGMGSYESRSYFGRPE
jgi:hypothetical protein